MQSDNRIFDDISKMASSAINTMLDVKKEIDAVIQQNMEHFINSAGVVSREEYEVMKEVATQARKEQERLEKRIAELEKQLGNKARSSSQSVSSAKKAPAKKKSPAKKSASTSSAKKTVKKKPATKKTTSSNRKTSAAKKKSSGKKKTNAGRKNVPSTQVSTPASPPKSSGKSNVTQLRPKGSSSSKKKA